MLSENTSIRDFLSLLIGLHGPILRNAAKKQQNLTKKNAKTNFKKNNNIKTLKNVSDEADNNPNNPSNPSNLVLSDNSEIESLVAPLSNPSNPSNPSLCLSAQLYPPPLPLINNPNNPNNLLDTTHNLSLDSRENKPSSNPSNPDKSANPADEEDALSLADTHKEANEDVMLQQRESEKEKESEKDEAFHLKAEDFVLLGPCTSVC